MIFLWLSRESFYVPFFYVYFFFIYYYRVRIPYRKLTFVDEMKVVVMVVVVATERESFGMNDFDMCV